MNRNTNGKIECACKKAFFPRLAGDLEEEGRRKLGLSLLVNK